MKIKNFFKRTPKRNKQIGRTATAIAGVVGTILTAGVVTAPIGITILTVVGAISTGVAVINGYQTEEKDLENSEN